MFRFVYTLPLRRNSGVTKISSDSESNSFANLSRISDEDIMEELQEDVEESLTHKLMPRVDLTHEHMFNFFFCYFVLFNSWVVCLSMGSLTLLWTIPVAPFLYFVSCH